MNGSDDQNRFSEPLPREISAEETDLVGGGWDWGAAFFVGGCASEGGPLAAAAGFIIGGLFG
jgi:hypothetical protein